MNRRRFLVTLGLAVVAAPVLAAARALQPKESFAGEVATKVVEPEPFTILHWSEAAPDVEDFEVVCRTQAFEDMTEYQRRLLAHISGQHEGGLAGGSPPNVESASALLLLKTDRPYSITQPHAWEAYRKAIRRR